MTAAALAYAADGWRVFPCQWRGPYRKQPLIQNGLRAATTDPATIVGWWKHWPSALIGFATGDAVVVLDIDIKADANGFDTLAELGFAILPETPMAHTASGGLHVYFRAPAPSIHNTAGARGRGIGTGLDWRGQGGYVIAPSAGSGYCWDPIYNPDTVPFAEAPKALLPREPQMARPTAAPARPANRLTPYAEGALSSAIERILAAPAGEQEATLNAECFTIGTFAAGGGVQSGYARAVLKWGAQRLTSYDHRRPWRPGEAEVKVDHAFDAGMRHPRRVA